MFLVKNMVAQIGYQKDSLQIKVYTEIDYNNRQVEAIRVDKVFCDYCTKLQKEAVGNEAYRRTYIERFDKNIRLIQGTYRHALFIRVAKKDFERIREEEEQLINQDSILNN